MSPHVIADVAALVGPRWLATKSVWYTILVPPLDRSNSPRALRSGRSAPGGTGNGRARGDRGLLPPGIVTLRIRTRNSGIDRDRLKVRLPSRSPLREPRESRLPMKERSRSIPSLPIVDAHHHLYDRPNLRYLFDELSRSASGHNVVGRFRSGRAMYRDRVRKPCALSVKTNSPKALRTRARPIPSANACFRGNCLPRRFDVGRKRRRGSRGTRPRRRRPSSGDLRVFDTSPPGCRPGMLNSAYPTTPDMLDDARFRAGFATLANTAPGSTYGFIPSNLPPDVLGKFVSPYPDRRRSLSGRLGRQGLCGSSCRSLRRVVQGVTPNWRLATTSRQLGGLGMPISVSPLRNLEGGLVLSNCTRPGDHGWRRYRDFRNLAMHVREQLSRRQGEPHLRHRLERDETACGRGDRDRTGRSLLADRCEILPTGNVRSRRHRSGGTLVVMTEQGYQEIHKCPRLGRHFPAARVNRVKGGVELGRTYFVVRQESTRSPFLTASGPSTPA